jgi:hypothetical protein
LIEPLRIVSEASFHSLGLSACTIAVRSPYKRTISG